MTFSDWLTALGLLLDILGSYCLLVASRFWEGWPESIKWMGTLFELNISRPSLWGLFSLFFGFLLQFIGLLAR
ncbi:MAG: hypothetical protein HY695_14645 [Deltaproteobacteria bacterium]|nr:hypothetical protein [Deltaproteobacteria bacterium]